MVESDDKKNLVETVKTNLMENGMQRRVPFSNDNYQVNLDPEKQQMKIVKRGQATIALKASNLPQSTRQKDRGRSPYESGPQNDGEEYFSDGGSTQFNF